MGIKNLMTVDNQRDLGVLITCNAWFNEHIYAQVLAFIHRTLSISEHWIFTNITISLYGPLRSYLDDAFEICSPRSIRDKASEMIPTTSDKGSPARAMLKR